MRDEALEVRLALENLHRQMDSLQRDWQRRIDDILAECRAFRRTCEEARRWPK